jgi:PAS domain S-box-containing protein
VFVTQDTELAYSFSPSDVKGRDRISGSEQPAESSPRREVRLDASHFRAIFESSLEAVLLTTADGTVIAASTEAAKLFQRVPDEMRGLTRAQLVFSGDARLSSAISAQERSGQFSGSLTMVRKDGSRFEAELSSTTFRDESGERLAYVFLRDITERRRAEKTMLASEHRYRSLIETTGSVIVGIAGDGMIFEWNREAERVFGYTRREVLGKDFLELFVPTSAHAAVRDELEKVVGGQSRRQLEIRSMSRSGEERVLLWNVTRLLDVAQLPVGVIASGQDITERIRIQEQSRHQSEILQKILDHIPLIIGFFDATARLTWVNQQATSALGWRMSDLTGRELRSDLFASAEEYLHAVEHLRAGTGMWRDLLMRRRDGQTLTTAWASVVLSDGTRIAIGQDVTDRRRAEQERQELEQQMQHAQKLESLGVLAGGIAHDFNNLLVGILGNASLALMDIEEATPLFEVVKDIETTALRAADLTKQMLAYSGRGRFVVRSVDLSALAGEMAHLLQTVISKKAKLRFEFAENLPTVEVDATQIRQIVMNLITNASDALTGRDGEIILRTGVQQCDRESLRSPLFEEALEPGLYAYVEVEDTGEGMTPETMSRIFEPFFSTKFTGRGLGLAATLGIVRGHKGTIKMRSTPGVGTTFRVLLPCRGAAVQPAPVEDPGTSFVTGTGTVLVVDDDPTVRAVARNMLERRGFSVLLASDGREGLEVYEREQRRIALALVDLTMPHMGGEELIREMRKRNPAVRAVLMSGYSENELARTEGMAEEVFVQKPFRLDEVDRCLRKVLRS